ncbi:MAG: shikimate dehydrogenase [Flavobacteriales bacterium]|nr:shikimate dehydrogenase [Flavobacteriales bacterium]
MKNKQFGLIGRNISYSFSKPYFTDKFKELNLDYTYNVFDIPQIDEVQKILDNDDVFGCNVTIPYKQEVIPFLDEISEAAKKVGAVNTIQFKDNKTIGHNTDVIGFENSFAPLLEKHHKKALIFGDGGASKAIEYVLKKLDIEYQIVSLFQEFKYENVTPKIIEEYTILINATPVGTYPKVNDILPIPTDAISNKHIVFDLIYNPEETLLLQKAKAKGAKIKNGLEMLYGQADASWEIWNS